MIDYTKAPADVRGIAKGVQRDKFDRLILTSRHVKFKEDDTEGLFYKYADPSNHGFKVYVLSDIKRVPDFATRYYLECEYPESSKLKKCFLVLEPGANDTYGGYKVIEIRHKPPLPYRPPK